MNLTRIFAESLLRRFPPNGALGSHAQRLDTWPSASLQLLPTCFVFRLTGQWLHSLKNGHWQEIGRLAYLPIDIEPLTYQAQVYPEYGAPQISVIFFMYTLH
jgi:hypothetical protein